MGYITGYENINANRCINVRKKGGQRSYSAPNRKAGQRSYSAADISKSHGMAQESQDDSHFKYILLERNNIKQIRILTLSRKPLYLRRHENPEVRNVGGRCLNVEVKQVSVRFSLQ